MELPLEADIQMNAEPVPAKAPQHQSRAMKGEPSVHTFSGSFIDRTIYVASLFSGVSQASKRPGCLKGIGLLVICTTCLKVDE